MGFYSKIIFPLLVNGLMSNRVILAQRRAALRKARGTVLEIGFGTGLNLGCYPPAVGRVIGVDINPGMNRLARRRIREVSCPVELVTVAGESLPFADASVDTVVSTWTLCSIAGIGTALNEIGRVLRPEGRFLFVEHGRSPEPETRRWQDRLTPVQKFIADGCHLNRPISRLIEQQGLEILELEEFYLEKTPRFAGYTYRGEARPRIAV